MTSRSPRCSRRARCVSAGKSAGPARRQRLALPPRGNPGLAPPASRMSGAARCRAADEAGDDVAPRVCFLWRRLATLPPEGLLRGKNLGAVREEFGHASDGEAINAPASSTGSRRRMVDMVLAPSPRPSAIWGAVGACLPTVFWRGSGLTHAAAARCRGQWRRVPIVRGDPNGIAAGIEDESTRQNICLLRRRARRAVDRLQLGRRSEQLLAVRGAAQASDA